MRAVAVICEYNPLHKGHIRQLAAIRSRFGEDCCIVCLMSGNYVQRGECAVFDKHLRAAAAVECGADLVLELPIRAALSSAEGFAMGAVDVLNRLGAVDFLCFGCESGRQEALMDTARLLRLDAFHEALRASLPGGESFAALRQRALTAVGGDGSLLERPNDILAVEYCKALLASGSTICPLAVQRGSADPENPSATDLRRRMPEGDWLPCIPAAARDLFAAAPLHRMAYGERAILARLRAMDDAEFETLPFGSEGLWRRLMQASRQAATLEEVITQVKSKRYTRARISRMILCAFLGLRDLSQCAQYVRILAFHDRGRAFLRAAAEKGAIPLLHAGEAAKNLDCSAELRADRLYSLFLPPAEICTIPAHTKVYCKK